MISRMRFLFSLAMVAFLFMPALAPVAYAYSASHDGCLVAADLVSA
jgi:hypothetical protein